MFIIKEQGLLRENTLIRLLQIKCANIKMTLNIT